MKALIHITEKDSRQVVSARELHKFLAVTTRFSPWIKRMLEYGFSEQDDYEITHIFEHNLKRGKRVKRDYALSLSCAKSIAMLQRSAKGKKARQYFIECEKKLQNIVDKSMSMEELLPLITYTIADHEQRISRLEEQAKKTEEELKLLKLQVNILPDNYILN